MGKINRKENLKKLSISPPTNRGRCVIVGGAEIKNYDLIREYLKNDDFFIFCDSGLNHQEKLCFKPNLIIGDFDSHSKPSLNNEFEIIVLPCEKDDTDTIFAVKEAIKRGYNDVLMIGVVGGRMDHTLGNVYSLFMLSSKKIKAKILDDYSEMEIILQGERVRVNKKFKYFSIVNILGKAKGIDITGAKYNLNNAEITSEYQYGISNEVSKDNEEAEIFVREGSLLLICVR